MLVSEGQLIVADLFEFCFGRCRDVGVVGIGAAFCGFLVRCALILDKVRLVYYDLGNVALCTLLVRIGTYLKLTVYKNGLSLFEVS